MKKEEPSDSVTPREKITREGEALEHIRKLILWAECLYGRLVKLDPEVDVNWRTIQEARAFYKIRFQESVSDSSVLGSSNQGADHLIPKILELLKDVEVSHRLDDSGDYSECDKDPCAWCEGARKVIATLQSHPDGNPKEIGGIIIPDERTAFDNCPRCYRREKTLFLIESEMGKYPLGKDAKEILQTIEEILERKEGDASCLSTKHQISTGNPAPKFNPAGAGITEIARQLCRDLDQWRRDDRIDVTAEEIAQAAIEAACVRACAEKQKENEDLRAQLQSIQPHAV